MPVCPCLHSKSRFGTLFQKAIAQHAFFTFSVTFRNAAQDRHGRKTLYWHGAVPETRGTARQARHPDGHEKAVKNKIEARQCSLFVQNLPIWLRLPKVMENLDNSPCRHVIIRQAGMQTRKTRIVSSGHLCQYGTICLHSHHAHRSGVKVIQRNLAELGRGRKKVFILIKNKKKKKYLYAFL